MSKVLVIGDIHEPACHVGYRKFCQDLYEQWSCDRVVFIGDIVDLLNISFHQKNVDADGVTREVEMAYEGVQKWCKAFPKAEVMTGNHDARVCRLAASVNIPIQFIRDYAEVWNTPYWDWKGCTTIDEVYYFHGEKIGGQSPALKRAIKNGQSSVMGHQHSQSGVRWSVGDNLRVFGMDTGCGIDVEHISMYYGRNFINKPILSAGAVIDGIPYHEIMPIGRGEKYHKSRFTRKTAK